MRGPTLTHIFNQIRPFLTWEWWRVTFYHMVQGLSKNVYSEEKLRELILLIAHKSKADPRLRAVKLNQPLYYADFTAYRRLGKSITGAEYQHLPEGPAPRKGLPAQERLKRDGAIEMVYEPSLIGEPLQYCPKT